MRIMGFTLALWCAVMAGCASLPFPEPEAFVSDGVALAEVPARFAVRLAPQFEQVNAVVFRFRLRELTALGMASVDLPSRSFAVTCMTPLGVKLFDVVCAGGRAEGRFVHPELAERGGDLAQAAGTDLTHAYLDWHPPPGAPYVAEHGRLIFTAADATGKTEYRYAGSDGRLTEKIRFERGRRIWEVNYRAYASEPDGLVPTGLVIMNRQYGYRLTVTTREEER